jgi:hypothetical protein
MYNYVVLEEDNDWLLKVDIAEINAKLRQREAECYRLIDDGTFWQIGERDRSELSPEVHEVAWYPAATVIELLSNTDGYVNDWQAAEFKKVNITKR